MFWSWFKRKSQAHQWRKLGFQNFVTAFNCHADTPDLDTVIVLKNVAIRIVGGCQKFDWPKAQIKSNGVAGYATSENEISILGKIVNEKVVLNQAAIGHEFTHLLNFKNPSIANPDELEELFE